MKLKDTYRNVENTVITGLSVLATVVVIVPLVSILIYLFYKGFSSVNLNFFLKDPVPVGEVGGGMGERHHWLRNRACTGQRDWDSQLASQQVFTWQNSAAAACWATPYASPQTCSTACLRSSSASPFTPLLVLPTHQFSAFAGGIALAIMMIPTITRTTEEMLATVPHAIREAALGLGVPKWRTTAFSHPAHGFAGHHHRLHVGLRPRRRRNRPAALHRAR